MERRIAIIGGGIAGLAAAFRVVELSRERSQPVLLRLFEAGSRVGGNITTERAGHFLVEGGPDSFLTEKPWAVSLVRRLGLENEVVGTREELRRTFVVHAGRLHALPEGFLLLAPTEWLPLVTSGLFSWPGKLRMGLDLVLPRRTSEQDESLSSFVSRRLGREALERVAQPLVGGIYTANPDQLSLQATMPRFHEMERVHGSVIRAMRSQRAKAASASSVSSGARWSLFASFRDGMQRLVDRLVAALPAEVVRCDARVESVTRSGHRWRLGGRGEFDDVIFATPAFETARLLRSLDAGSAAELDAIAYASSATVTLAYRREEIPHPLDGFGFVVPRIEGHSILAATFSSLKYPGRAPAEWVLIRAFVGGALQPETLRLDDSDLLLAVRRDLMALLGISVQPSIKRIFRYHRAMPQYGVGHLDRVARIEAAVASLTGVHLAGSAYRGVGIPDCIHSGEAAAEAAFPATAIREDAASTPDDWSGS